MPTTEQPLAGRRLLVTRPAGRAEELIAALRAVGAEVEHIPLLAIESLSEESDSEACRRLRSIILELDRYQRIIAVSVNAVEHGFDWIQRYWPQLPIGIRWYGIGAATVAALEAEAVTAAAPTASMTTEALLAEPEFASLEGERVLILRGIGGRAALADALRERGATVDYAECYRRVVPELGAAERKQLSSSAFDAVSINSGETLTYFQASQHLATAGAVDSEESGLVADHLAPCGAQTRGYEGFLIVPSERVAALARSLGFARVAVAANAGVAATVAAAIAALAGS